MLKQPTEERNVNIYFLASERKRIEMLNKALGDIELTEEEERTLLWLCGLDDSTVKSIISAFEKAEIARQSNLDTDKMNFSILKKEFKKYFSSVDDDTDIDINYLIFFLIKDLKTLNHDEWSWGYTVCLNTNSCCDDTENETAKNDFNRIDIYDYEEEFEREFDKKMSDEIGWFEEIRIYRCSNCKHIFICTA
jgi:hypothetical protein